ncbi:hypothetical protein D3C84_1024080 [compost metagenome]
MGAWSRYLTALEQSLQGGSRLTVEPRQQRRLAGELDLAPLAEADRLRRSLQRLALPSRRHPGVAHAPLLVDPGEILAILVAAGIATSLQDLGADVIG